MCQSGRDELSLSLSLRNLYLKETSFSSKVSRTGRERPKNHEASESRDVESTQGICKLILLAPASNAEGERIFSGVRRVKTYLRSTMKQDRLNDLMMIHVHKDRINRLSIIDMANEFASRNHTRRVKFGPFKEQDLKLTAGERRSIGTQTSSP